MEKKWLRRKPETNLDWLGIVLSAILFYVILQHFGVVQQGMAEFSRILTPFAGGVVIAYCINPLVKWSMKWIFRGNERFIWLAILLGYIVALAVVALLGVLIVPQTVSSLITFYNNLDAYSVNLTRMLTELNDRYSWLDLSSVILVTENLNETVAALLEQYVMPMLMESAPQIITYLGGMTSTFVMVFTAIASSVYLLMQKESLLRHARVLTRAFLPSRVAEYVLQTCHDANRNLGGFFAGKIVDSLIIGLMTFVSMQLLHLSYAPLISIIVGITNIIPVFGPFIGAVPGCIILLFLEPWQALVFLILILVIQQLDGNVIGPMILGDSIGISALWVLVSIVVGGDLFGLAGMVMGVPVFATIYGVVKGAAAHCLKQKGIYDGNGSMSEVAGAPIPDAPGESVRKTLTWQYWKEKFTGKK